MKYDDIEKLNELRSKGAITEEEFQKEKEKILSSENNPQSNSVQGPWGMEENAYCTIMHLSQLLNVCGLGWIIPIVMWIINKDQYPMVDIQGKIIINWTISAFIYAIVCGLLVFVAIGVFLLPVLGALCVIFAIIGAVKANQGIIWVYPLSISFFKLDKEVKSEAP